MAKPAAKDGLFSEKQFSASHERYPFFAVVDFDGRVLGNRVEVVVGVDCPAGPFLRYRVAEAQMNGAAGLFVVQRVADEFRGP